MDNNLKLKKKKSSLQIVIPIVIIAVLALVIAAVVVMNKKYSNNERGTISSVDDLPGKKIGVQIGTTGDLYASDYEGDNEGTQVIRYNKGTDAVQALKQDKIDCVIIDEQPANAFIENNKELAILKEDFALEDYAICISKESKELKSKINDALDDLKKDGTLEKIKNNYIGDDTKGKFNYQSPEGTEYNNGTLIMATNAEFPPYEYFEGGNIVGIDVDIAHAIADKIGMKLEVTNMEFDSIIIAVQSGKADIGVAGMTVTEDRLRNIDFSDSYTTSKQVVIIKVNEAASGVTLVDKLRQAFIEDARYKYIVKGLRNTLIITLCAGIIGILLGFIIAVIRVSKERNDECSAGMKFANVIAGIYITIFRGTPMVVQLLIMYYVIFASVSINPIIAAIIAFGLNSGAYVAEAIRSGIIAIPVGQFEAGRSLGFNYAKTMIYIILPQAVKNSLPAICNEFIALLKESSIVGYIGMQDLTKAGDIIRSNTYEAFVPLISVALIYLILVLLLTALVGKLERRLSKYARK